MSDPTTIPIDAVRTVLGKVATLVGDWQARQTTPDGRTSPPATTR